jgi:flagellar biosynthesis/type III secretory pathway chaperone
MRPESLEHYKKLDQLLSDVIRVYRHLLAVVRKEREILISSNLDDLNENNKAKEAMLLKARSLEEERQQCCRELALLEGLEPDNTKLLDFARHFGGEEGEKLRRVHSVLDLVIKRVREFNQQNELLVHSALDTITGAMTDIKETIAPKKTYQKGGKMASANPGSGSLVRKEI